MTCKELYNIFKAKNWIDETIDLVNDDVLINNNPELDIEDEVPKIFIKPVVDSETSDSEDELEVLNPKPTIDDYEKEFEKAVKNKKIMNAKSVKKSISKKDKYSLNSDKAEEMDKLSGELDKFI
jgi:hypothetical protein